MTGPSRRDLLGRLVEGLVLALVLPACRAGARDATRRSPDMALDQLMVTVDAVRAAQAPFALQGRFSVRLESPGSSGSTKGALILHRPDRFRIELLTPLGTPLLYLASNGKALHAWSQRDGRFYRGDDAGQVLAQLTGGAVGLADVNALLTGMLPLPDAPIVSVDEDEQGMVRLSLQAPQDVRVLAILDPHELITRELRVVRLDPGEDLPVQGMSDGVLTGGETLVEVRYAEVKRVGGNRLPEQILVSLPTLGWSLELEFLSWDELGQIPEVFELVPPAGAVEADLVATLRELAEKQAAQGS